jgi:inorganic pyrophosphatase
MDPVKDLPTGKNAPETVYVFIEVPKGCPIKFEFDKKLGVIKVDRYLYSPMFYPGDYGLIPRTHCDDGDPLDGIVLVSHPSYPGVVIEARPIGVLRMEDEKGLDDKLICVPVDDPRFETIKDVSDLPEHVLKEIANFFETYKSLEPGKWVKVRGWEGVEKAKEVIKHAMELYLRKHGNGE